MYLFYMMTNGYIPYGTDGMIEIYAHTPNGVRRRAKAFKDNRPGSVYFFEDWTPKMSELSGIAFEEYIRENGIQVA